MWKYLVSALLRLDSVHYAAAVISVLLVAVVGYFAGDFEGIHGPTLVFATVVVVLCFIVIILSKRSVPRCAAGIGWAWESGHRLLPIMKETLDLLQLAYEQVSSGFVDLGGRWRRFAEETWKLRARGSCRAVAVQLEVLEDRYCASLLRNMLTGETNVPLKLFIEEEGLREILEDVLKRDPPVDKELRKAVEELQGRIGT